MKWNNFVIFVLGVLLLGFVVGAEYIPGELIVKYEDSDISTDSLLLSSLDTKDVGNNELVVLRFNETEDMVELAEVYSNLDDVEYAEPNYIYHNFAFVNDVNYSEQWYLEDVSIDDAWNLTFGNESIVIAIIDTGADWDHEDLVNKIWNNSDEVMGNAVDDDLNGYVDDVRGWDFVNFSSGDAARYCFAEEDCMTEDNDSEDVQGHGTHCAGIAGAEANNSIGIAGVCPNCEVMILRAGFKDTSGDGSFTTTDVVEAIDYAVNNNASVISMSWGGSSDSQAIEDSLQVAYDAGLILVAAAGNDGLTTYSYPAAYDFVIAVGSTDNLGEKSSFSNYGSWVEIAAPGSDIFSTYISNSYTYLDGTSMATPLVAGVVGLMKSVFNNLNQSEILSALIGAGEDVVGYGMKEIDVYAALMSFDPDVYLVSPFDDVISLDVNQSFFCNVSDWELENLSLFLWNSSGDVYYNDSVDVSGDENSSVFNVTNMSFDVYEWNCLGSDAYGNSAWGSSNFSLVISGVEVDLISPENDSYTNVNFTEFNCSVRSDSNYSLVNLSFFIWNSSGILLKNESVNVSGDWNSSIFNYTFLSDDSYVWGCVGLNNNSDVDGVNYTVTYDSGVPVVSDVAVLTTTSSATVSWNTDDMTNSSLWVTNKGWTNSSNRDISHSVLVSGLSSGTSYNYVIFSCDMASNCVNESGSFTTSNVVIASGGGGKTISNSKSQDGVYEVKSSEIFSGYTKELKEGEKLNFSLYDFDGGQHLLTFNQIWDDYVILTIESDPIYLKLKEEEFVKLNLSSSNYYDLFLKVESINGENVEFTIRLINEPIIFEVEEEVIEVEEEAVIEKQDYSWIVVFLVVFLIVVFLKNSIPKKLKEKESKNKRNGKDKKVKA